MALDLSNLGWWDRTFKVPRLIEQAYMNADTPEGAYQALQNIANDYQLPIGDLVVAAVNEAAHMDATGTDAAARADYFADLAKMAIDAGEVDARDFQDLGNLSTRVAENLKQTYTDTTSSEEQQDILAALAGDTSPVQAPVVEEALPTTPAATYTGPAATTAGRTRTRDEIAAEPIPAPQAGIEDLAGTNLMEETFTLGESMLTDTSENVIEEGINDASKALDASIANVNPYTEWITNYLEGVDPLGTAAGLLSPENIYGDDYMASKQTIADLLSGNVNYAKTGYDPEAIQKNFYSDQGLSQDVLNFVNNAMQREGTALDELAQIQSEKAAEEQAQRFNLLGGLMSGAGTAAVSKGAAEPIAQAQADIAARQADLLAGQTSGALRGLLEGESEKYQAGLGTRNAEIAALQDLLSEETATKSGLASQQADLYGDVLQSLMGYGTPDMVVSPEQEAGVMEILSGDGTWAEKLDALINLGIDVGSMFA